MGVWTVPWENEAKAKEFASKIKEGIHVKIEKSPLGELVIISDEISFRFDQEALFGSDELTDLIYDEATENEVQNFNITKLIICVLEPLLRQMEIQPELPQNLKEVNIVRESIGLAPLSVDRPLSDSAVITNKIITNLKQNNIAIVYYD